MVTMGLAVLAIALGFQEAPDISVGVRPAAIRVGDRAMVTVRVRSSIGLPEFIEWEMAPGIILEDIRDRSSAGLGSGGAQGWTHEREFVLRGEAAGTYQLPPVEVYLAGQVFQKDGPELTVSSVPLLWSDAARRAPGPRPSRSDRENPPILPEGSPPMTGEMGGAYQGAPGAYGQWWGYPPYASAYPWGLYGLSPYGGYGGYGGSQGGIPGQVPSLYGPGLLGQTPYGPSPTGPNGGWPMGPPGSAPGLDSQPWMGWPGFLPSGGSWYPGMAPTPFPYSGQGQFPQGNLGVPGPLTPGTTPISPLAQGHTLPPLPGGRWPEGMGGGWAETATGDPWWPEIVPELFEFSAWNETAGGEASLGAAITTIRAFVGQQVTYVATAAMQPGAFLGLGSDPEYLPPSPPGFWTVDVPDPLVATPSASGGGVAQSYTFRRALFPLESGEYMMPPGQLLLPTGSSRNPDLLSWDTLSVDPMALTVLPIPAPGELPGYAGAVGRYRLEAGLTPERLAVGETALLVVRVMGVGNVNTLPPPEIPPIYGAEVATGTDFAAVEVRDGVVGGVRTFTWLVVPLEAGPIRIGPILFSYFDPYLGDFNQAVYEELTLDVTEFPGGF